MIIQDLQLLHSTRCTPNYNENSNKEVVKKLAIELAKNPVGNKLACNQIGITANRVVMVNVEYPLYLINPRIIKNEIPIVGISDDLSFPQKIIRTYKFASIVVESDNFKEPIRFGVLSSDEEIAVTDPRVMRCIAIQHVVDLLNGITMFEREYNEDIIKSPTKRSISITNSKGEIKTIKSKYLNNFINQGWHIIE